MAGAKIKPFGRAHRLVAALLLAVMVVLPNTAFALTLGWVASKQPVSGRQTNRLTPERLPLV